MAEMEPRSDADRDPADTDEAQRRDDDPIMGQQPPCAGGRVEG